jgi:DNA-binding CsgD family transcriptional regulator
MTWSFTALDIAASSSAEVTTLRTKETGGNPRKVVYPPGRPPWDCRRVTDAVQTALAMVERLAAEPRSLVAFWDDVSDVLRDTVPHHTFPCWFTVDPASLLITSHYNPWMPELPRDSLAAEYYEEDVNQIATVARSRSGVSTLHDATDGDPSSSPRWQANARLGADQELVAALRTRSGVTWASLSLYREPGRPLFNHAEQDLVRQMAPALAEGARRALLFGEATDPDDPRCPGLLVLTQDWRVESSTPGTQEWLDELPDSERHRLPASVLAVAGRALRADLEAEPPEVATARVLTRSGRWVVLHGAVLDPGPHARVAVIVEPAHPARITGLLMAAYGLTEREQDVTRLVLQGRSTTEIAAELVLSVHTVQQHLKGIFAKTGVRSRRDLVAKVFFAHYEPRLRDNEARVPLGRPLRGGPMPWSGVGSDHAEVRPTTA